MMRNLKKKHIVKILIKQILFFFPVRSLFGYEDGDYKHKHL